MIRCTCCQAEITAPQFYNGLPYGYTCITKVSGQKRTKVVYTAVEYTVLQGAGTQRQVVRVTAYGQKKNIVFYVCSTSSALTLEEGKVSGAYYQDGVLYVSEGHLESSGFSLTPPTPAAPTAQGKGKTASAIELLLAQALKA